MIIIPIEIIEQILSKCEHFDSLWYFNTQSAFKRTRDRMHNILHLQIPTICGFHMMEIQLQIPFKVPIYDNSISGKYYSIQTARRNNKVNHVLLFHSKTSGSTTCRGWWIDKSPKDCSQRYVVIIDEFNLVIKN